MSSPTYWYNDFWMQQIYKNGVESCAKTEAYGTTNNVGVCEDNENIFIPKQEGPCFFWVPKISIITKDSDGFPIDVKTNTLRLYAKEEGTSKEYLAVVDAVRAEECDHLIACRQFHTGDPITFLSIEEEKKKMIFVGGSFARQSLVPDQCNAYLTAGRMLRCTRPIKKGEEIVRMASCDESMEYFERIDRVVLSSELVVGRIAPDAAGVEDAIVVNYADGRTEIVTTHAGLSFAYKKQTM